jgi:hypothetical protein
MPNNMKLPNFASRQTKRPYSSQYQLLTKLYLRNNKEFSNYYILTSGPGSSVGIATELPGWTVRGSNPRGSEIFRTCPDRPWCPPSLLYNG